MHISMSLKNITAFVLVQVRKILQKQTGVHAPFWLRKTTACKLNKNISTFLKIWYNFSLLSKIRNYNKVKLTNLDS